MYNIVLKTLRVILNQERVKKGAFMKGNEKLEPEKIVLPEVKLPSQDEVNEQVKKNGEYAQKVYEWIEKNLPATLSLIKNTPKGEFQELASKAIAEVQKTVKNLLSNNSIIIRRAAWLAVLKVYFSQEIGNWVELRKLLKEMTTEGLLLQKEEDVPDALKACGKKFIVPEKSGFRQEETDEITKIFGEFRTKIWKAENDRSERKAETLNDQGEITLEQLLSGEKGVCCIEIPATNKGDKVMGGGKLLVESNGVEIFPLDATHGLETPITIARDLGAYLLINSLNRPYPPKKETLKSIGFTGDQAQKIQLLWHLVKRAIEAMSAADKKIAAVA